MAARGASAAFTGSWSIGHPAKDLAEFWGVGLEIALFAGIALGLAGTALAALVRETSDDVQPRSPGGGLLLAGMLALACPAGAALVSLLAADQFLPRNLAASWPGLALVLAAVLTRGPRLAWIPATTLVLAVFAVGAIRTTEADWGRPDVGSAAAFIEAETGPGDVVVDTLAAGGGGDLPVRETLAVEMTKPFDRAVSAELPEALQRAAGGRLAVVGPPLLTGYVGQAPELADLTPVERRVFAGTLPTEVLVYDIPAESRG